ncbi:GGDEF domain-containing protein [Lichenihabitans sp. Uapishka_5]|uniref:GGDEF domain-containing protein n=1 Tax=Lichenihabitans sp. Uapishka_5 TaxID=3037302 RepID=UPI0029E7D1CA|nr:GGDEF domain-containing protein [Lichenihabitans sp. Uapishka_5]MDX7952693.1 GGDEF domain-containing protein [Lichenihabitans sp. Uapishka_5]
MVLSWLRRLASSQIRSDAELTSYGVRTTALCVTAALAFDIVNQLVFFESWSIALRSWAMTIVIVVIIATPVTRTIGKANLALFRASRTDPLTGLLNRRALFEGSADPDALMVLMIADVDRFKAVNDTHGHMTGDAVLFTIAGLLQRELGALGRVGRLGGEEFALLCGRHDHAALMEHLERFRTTVAQTPVVAGATAVSVTLSAGVAHRDSGQSFEQLYAEADRALYRAKAQGRNRIVVAGEAVEAPLAPLSQGPALGALA